jgi:rubrerythrin
MSSTLTAELLQKAITGEFNASQRYNTFADIATNEGFRNVAYLFKALVAAEKIHLKNHNQALQKEFKPDIEDFKPGTTQKNLQNSIEGENYEFNEMYLDFIKQVSRNDKSEYGEVAELSMVWARKVEFTHAEILSKALEKVKLGKDIECNEIYVCKVCGNIVLEKTETICPVCGHDPLFYFLVPRE